MIKRWLPFVAILCLALPVLAGPERNNLVLGGTQEPPNLCPWEGYAASKGLMLGLLNVGLTYVEPDGTLRPGLATEIPSEENGRLTLIRDEAGNVIGQEVLWTIRADAYWSDGVPITADDAVFSFEVQNTPVIPVMTRAWSNLIEDVTRVDEKTFCIAYNQQHLFFAYPHVTGLCVWFDLAPKHIWGPIFDHVMEAIDAAPDDALAIVEGQFVGAGPSVGAGPVVGSGPFEFQEWDIGQYIRVRRRDDFFFAPPGPPESYIQGITYRYVISQPTLVSAILAGEIDAPDTIGLSGMDPDVLESQLGDRGTVEVALDGWLEKLNCNTFASCQTARDLLLHDKRTRQALIQAIDREDLAATVHPGSSVVHSFILPGDLGYNDALAPWTYNPAAASALLSELGWSDSDGDGWLDRVTGDGRHIDFVLHWVSDAADFRHRTGEILQEFMADIGIKLDIENLPGVVIFAGDYINSGSECAWRGLFEYANLGGLDMAPADPLSSELWANDLLENPVDAVPENIPCPENAFSGQNMTGWSHETFDRLRAEALRERDKDKRAEIVRQMQVIFHDELPYIPLYTQVSVIAKATGLVNYLKISPVVRFLTWNCWEWGWEQNGAIAVR